MLKLLFKLLKNHYKNPTGILGKMVGFIMDRLNDAQNDWVVSLLQIKPDDVILEIGYGSGKTIHKIAPRLKTGKIFGVDTSSSMWRVASKRNKKDIKSGKVVLKCSSLQAADYAENMFDTVFAVHVVYFWTDLQKVFREIYKILKPGGVCAIYLVHPILEDNEEFISYTAEEITKSLKMRDFHEIKIEKKQFGQQNGICLLSKK